MVSGKKKSAKTSAGEPHIALLRGVNVGGNNRLAMKDLAAMFETAGCRDGKTYIQSGNVVFKLPPARLQRLRNEVERALFSQLGNKITVVVRTAAQLRAIARANPFLAGSADPAKIHAAFLLDMPSTDQVAALDAERFKPDLFVVRGQEIFLHYPNGMARSKLTNTYLDRTLKTTATVRNWNTVLALLELATT